MISDVETVVSAASVASDNNTAVSPCKVPVNEGRRMKSLRKALEKTVDKCVSSAKYAFT